MATLLSTKGKPPSQKQKDALTEVVADKPAIKNESHGIHVMNEKAKAWIEVTEAFNLCFPFLEAKTERLLQRAWKYIKQRQNSLSFDI